MQILTGDVFTNLQLVPVRVNHAVNPERERQIFVVSIKMADNSYMVHRESHRFYETETDVSQTK